MNDTYRQSDRKVEDIMIVLVGIAAYLGMAVFVGRFLSLSTRGEVAYAAAAGCPTRAAERPRMGRVPAGPAYRAPQGRVLQGKAPRAGAGRASKPVPETSPEKPREEVAAR
ncbi:MAG: hypothetical protein EHM19_01485 [Candidatus Latescibacterota bacterium]|nr:MAG: hypothetical protein EHM19_01485 [Candidatus Latescibacterota bacterium]